MGYTPFNQLNLNDNSGDKMELKKIALAVAALTLSSGALAHGYVESPQSRAYKCNLQENTDCGAVQYEPQSVEKDSGFPTGPLPRDGELASASIPHYSPLDKQSMNMWAKNPIKAGMNTFTWFHTAMHKTNNWRYYITKQNWDANQPLTRAAFEAMPFCQAEGHGQMPAQRAVHECNVPQRSGYQVIYGVWEIADTVNSFYQVIDVDFGGGEGVTSPWSKQLSGQVSGKDLKKGDKVIARFFDDQGEVTSLRSEMTIDNQKQTDKNRWSHDLAVLINAKHDDVRIGVKDTQGSVNPVYGNNSAFVKDDSRLSKVVMSYEEQAPGIEEEVEISGVQVDKIQDGHANVSFNVNVKGEVTFEARVFDHHGSEKGYLKQSVTDDRLSMTLPLNDVTAGHHMLKYFATNKEGQLVKQDVINLQLEDASSGNYQYIFPEGLDSYTAGTVVLQPKNGKTYQCKPFPYSGYCTQWASGKAQFEPGIGEHWQQAWILKN
ncbi:GlcNAc-binding protein A precursor [Serratia quinivorans]|nr:GlcNAc-binding protein A precursor [Serratia quinivorans]VEI74287.1 GlcNAc-binding protein A precursor [Serratia quinivorans]